MRTGDLVRFKARGAAFELGGHRYLDSKRHWWVASSYMLTNVNDVYVIIEKNPRTYGLELELTKEKNTVVIMDASTRQFLIVSTRQIKTVNSVQRLRE
jgi:hypothetical protein